MSVSSMIGSALNGAVELITDYWQWMLIAAALIIIYVMYMLIFR